MTKIDFYNLFNEKLLEFAKDLCDVFPHINEFKRFRNGILLLINIEPKTLEKFFKTYVLNEYRDHLLKKDDRFFLEHNGYQIYSQRTDYWLELIEQLKKMWKTLDHENRDIIWKYFHVLIVLSDKCKSS